MDNVPASKPYRVTVLDLDGQEHDYNTRGMSAYQVAATFLAMAQQYGHNEADCVTLTIAELCE